MVRSDRLQPARRRLSGGGVPGHTNIQISRFLDYVPHPRSQSGVATTTTRCTCIWLTINCLSRMHPYSFTAAIPQSIIERINATHRLPKTGVIPSLPPHDSYQRNYKFKGQHLISFIFTLPIQDLKNDMAAHPRPTTAWILDTEIPSLLEACLLEASFLRHASWQHPSHGMRAGTLGRRRARTSVRSL